MATVSEKVQETGTKRLLESGAKPFSECFDNECCDLKHHLVGNPLFERDRILQLAKFVKRNANNVVYDAGKVNVQDRWDVRPVPSRPDRFRPFLRPFNVLRRGPGGRGAPGGERFVSDFPWQRSTAIALVYDVSDARMRFWCTP